MIFCFDISDTSRAKCRVKNTIRLPLYLLEGEVKISLVRKIFDSALQIEQAVFFFHFPQRNLFKVFDI